jgi:hypothetical protein
MDSFKERRDCDARHLIVLAVLPVNPHAIADRCRDRQKKQFFGTFDGDGLSGGGWVAMSNSGYAEERAAVAGRSGHGCQRYLKIPRFHRLKIPQLRP